jgi:hypothetical protein
VAATALDGVGSDKSISAGMISGEEPPPRVYDVGRGERRVGGGRIVSLASESCPDRESCFA